MNIGDIILLLNAGSTWFMVGLIWFVQVVHYPLFNRVQGEHHDEYHHQHQVRTTWVVGPPMLIEAFTSVLLVWYQPVSNTPLVLLGVALLFLIWVSTALLQVPCHGKLANGFDQKAYRQLVLTNWVRTLAWSLRGVLVIYLLACGVGSSAVGL